MITLNKGYYFLNKRLNDIVIDALVTSAETVKTKLATPIILYLRGRQYTANFVCYANTDGTVTVWFEDSEETKINDVTLLSSGFRMNTLAIEVVEALTFADLVLSEFFTEWPYTFQGEAMPNIPYGQWQFTASVFTNPPLGTFSEWTPVAFFLNNGEKFIGIQGKFNDTIYYLQEDETAVLVFDGTSWVDTKYQTFWLSEIFTTRISAYNPVAPDIVLSWILWYNQAEYIDSTAYSITINQLPIGLTSLTLNVTRATPYRLIQITPQLETNYTLTSLTYNYGENTYETTYVDDGTYEFIMPNEAVSLVAEVALDETEPDPDPEEPGTGGGTDPEPEPEEPGGGGGDNPGTGESGGNDDDNEDTKPYQGFAVATMFGQRLKSAGNYPLIRAQDVEMKDGTRLHDFNPLPPVGEEGMVLKVENGKWAAGWTIRAERDDEDSAILNIF